MKHHDCRDMAKEGDLYYIACAMFNTLDIPVEKSQLHMLEDKYLCGWAKVKNCWLRTVRLPPEYSKLSLRVI